MKTSPPTGGMLPRDVAAAVVRRWLQEGAFADRLVPDRVADHALTLQLVYGVVRWRRALDFVLRATVRRAPSPEVEAVLLVGLYQTLFMPGMAAHAAVHETVEAARRAGMGHAAGLVNAVLRRTLRERDAWLARLDAAPDGVRFSHPDTLVERWNTRYGPARTRRLLEWNNLPAPVTLRPVPAHGTVEAYAQRLLDGGIRATPHPFDPQRFLTLPHGVRVPDLPGYAQGAFMVQDPATAAAVDLLDPRPGERILDACAAPGGKTVLIAERVGPDGYLLALDRDAARLRRLEQNLARTGHAKVEVRLADAGEAREPQTTPFDGVLLDVPCTNTGVLRRRPDARWRFSRERLQRLASLQRRLLEAVSACMRPGGGGGGGGRLVYSTCSLEPEEGPELVRGVCDAQPGLALDAEVSLFPPESGTDGVYAARLVYAPSSG